MANRQIVLKEKPSGKLAPEHFSLREVPVPTPGPGEVLARTVLLSLDAANRAWMHGRTYTDPVESGDVMHGFTLARVEASNDPGFKPGDIVEAMNGWQDYAVHKPKALAKVTPVKPLSYAMSVLGVTGKTAYFGMLEIGKPKPGETVLVSAAAGAVGSIAGQIAKLKGARVIGIAGGPKKCAWLREIGFDGAIDYRNEDVGAALDRLCPDGVDVNFENVGGDIMNAVIARMNTFSRMPLCGLISTYNAEVAAGPADFGRVLMKRILIRGFIVINYLPRAGEAFAELAPWVASGQLKWKAHVVEGLENAAEAVNRLFTGDHDGKLLVQISPEP